MSTLQADDLRGPDLVAPRRTERWGVATALAGPVVAVVAWTFVFLIRHETRVSSDGASYVETAQRILDGRGFGRTLVDSAAFNPVDTAHFPPGLSLVLALLMRFGLSAITAAILVNGASWIASLVGCVALYRRAGGRMGAWLFGLLGWLVVCGSVVDMHESVRSGPLFVALAVWFLYLGERWLGGDCGWRLGLSVVVLGAAAISVRYVGIFLIAAAAIRVLQQGGSWGRIASRLSAVAAMVAPIALWYLANQDAVRQDAPGATHRAATFVDVNHSLGALGSIFSGGVVYSLDEPMLGPFDPLIRPLVQLVGLALLAAAAGTAVWWWRRQGRTRAERLVPARRSGYLLIVDYVAVATVGLFAYRIPSGFSVLFRYWIPVVVPAAVLVVARCSRSRWARTYSPPNSALVPVAIGAFVSINAIVALYYQR